MVNENQVVNNPEKRIEINQSLTDRLVDGAKGIPAILGCAAGAYLLDFATCVKQISSHLQDGPNFGYHLAAGAGMYGGWTRNDNRKMTTLIALGGSFMPEFVAVVQTGDIKQAATSAGIKAAGYGIGYIVGHIFRTI